MFPWLYLWAPIFRFPYSGAVNQNIQPQTDWFVTNVRPGAGVADIEREVVRDVASYGTQLGKLTDAVLALADQTPGAADAGTLQALDDLRSLRAEVKAAKEKVRTEQTAWARDALQRLATTDPEALASLLAEFRRS